MDSKSINTLSLAYLGDAVYEVYIREHLINIRPNSHAHDLHKHAVAFVCAGAQAKIVKEMLEEGFLSEDEMAVVKRGRNHKTTTKAKNADPVEYKWATAFETLIGYLKVEEKEERLNEVLKHAVDIVEKKNV